MRRFAIILLCLLEGIVLSRPASGGKLLTRNAKMSKYQWIDCRDRLDCSGTWGTPSAWAMGHTSIYSEAINAFVRRRMELEKQSVGVGATKPGLVLADRPVRVPGSLSPYVLLFSTIDEARQAYRGSVGRSLVVIRTVEPLSAPKGVLAVTFFADDYASRVRDGNWEMDWQGYAEFVAVRRSDGVLEIRNLGGGSS